MRVKIVETCVYVIEAPDAAAAESLFLREVLLPNHDAIEFCGTTARHVIEQPEELAQVVPIR